MAARFFTVDSGNVSRRILRYFVVDSGNISRRIRRGFVVDSGGISRQFYAGDLRFVTVPGNAEGVCNTGGCLGTPCIPSTGQLTPNAAVESGTGAYTFAWTFVSGFANHVISNAAIANPTWSRSSSCNNNSIDVSTWRLTVSDGVSPNITADITVTTTCANTC